MVLRSALFWDITQSIVLMPYRRLGTTYRFPLNRRDMLSSVTLRRVQSSVTKKSFLDFLIPEDWTDKLSRNVGKELHCTLSNITEEHRTPIIRGGILKSLSVLLVYYSG